MRELTGLNKALEARPKSVSLRFHAFPMIDTSARYARDLAQISAWVLSIGALISGGIAGSSSDRQGDC